MRRKIVAGNWKMNKTPDEAKALCELLLPLVKDAEAEVVFCVPAIDIATVVEAVKGSNVKVGGENLYFEDKGAFTGEISADMLKNAGCEYVIIGHSERRGYFGETDADVNKKVKKALEKGLTPIMCCGESLEQREQGITAEWVAMQVKLGLEGIPAEDVQKMVIAYEPIWAIGTGKTATTEQAEEVCRLVRDTVRHMYGDKTAEALRVQYGGSVKLGKFEMVDGLAELHGGTLTLTNNAGLNMGTVANGKLTRFAMKGGSLYVNDSKSLWVGANGRGLFHQTGGEVSSGYYPSVGRYAGSEGRLNVHGGTFTHRNQNYIRIGELGTGVVSVANGGTFTDLAAWSPIS